MKRFLAPRWIIGHLLAVAVVVAFIFFGFWQLDRHSQKREIKDGVDAVSELPVVPIEELTEGEMDYRWVVATGDYDTGTEVLAFGSLGGVSGYHVLTPMRLVDGRAIVVNRGWVPLEYDSPPVAPARPMEGVLEVTGQVWPSSQGEIPAELPPIIKNVDTGVVDAFTAYRLMDPYLILQEQDPPVPGDLPATPDLPTVSLGPHLGYAGQWFLFAAVVLVGYPLLLRRRLRD